MKSFIKSKLSLLVILNFLNQSAIAKVPKLEGVFSFGADIGGETLNREIGVRRDGVYVSRLTSTGSGGVYSLGARVKKIPLLNSRNLSLQLQSSFGIKFQQSNYVGSHNGFIRFPLEGLVFIKANGLKIGAGANYQVFTSYTDEFDYKHSIKDSMSFIAEAAFDLDEISIGLRVGTIDYEIRGERYHGTYCGFNCSFAFPPRHSSFA